MEKILVFTKNLAKTAYQCSCMQHFMENRTPCHKAKTVTLYLKDKKVVVVPWPGNSPTTST